MGSEASKAAFTLPVESNTPAPHLPTRALPSTELHSLGKADLARLPEESPGPREGAPCAQGHTDTEAGVRGRVTDPHTNPQRLDDTHPHERHSNVTPNRVTCRPRTLDSSG